MCTGDLHRLLYHAQAAALMFAAQLALRWTGFFARQNTQTLLKQSVIVCIPCSDMQDEILEQGSFKATEQSTVCRLA